MNPDFFCFPPRSLEMAVSNVSGYWSISNASVELDSQKYEIIMDSVSAPVGFSYHCSSLGRLTGNATDKNLTVSFLGFQVSPQWVEIRF